MKKNLFLTALFILAMSVISCSKDDDFLNHDLDNTVWEPEGTSRTHMPGLIFSDGYMQSVTIDKESGSIGVCNFSVKYSLDRAGERILLYFDARTVEYSYKRGFIFGDGDRYYLR